MPNPATATVGMPRSNPKSAARPGPSLIEIRLTRTDANPKNENTHLIRPTWGPSQKMSIRNHAILITTSIAKKGAAIVVNTASRDVDAFSFSCPR